MLTNRRKKRYIWPRMDKANICIHCAHNLYTLRMCLCLFLCIQSTVSKRGKSNDLHLRHGHPISQWKEILYLSTTVIHFFFSISAKANFFAKKSSIKLSFLSYSRSNALPFILMKNVKTAPKKEKRKKEKRIDSRHRNRDNESFYLLIALFLELKNFN